MDLKLILKISTCRPMSSQFVELKLQTILPGAGGSGLEFD
jgi:hypothetical protein